MAFFYGTLRGDGLATADRALAVFEEDPQQLEHARSRFNDSPPSYQSHMSHETTYISPGLSGEDKRRYQHEASRPYKQFRSQAIAEYKLLSRESWRVPVGAYFDNLADENVKKRWVEQGIWNDKWTDVYSIGARWKHEEPLELESESETDTEVEPDPCIFLKPQQKRRRQKSDEEKQRIAERLAIREREREASRPFYQFVYQVSKERERILEKSGSMKVTATTAADINTEAHKNVKNTWIRRGIWNERWGILPGMSWKHEQPFEQEADNDPVPFQNAQPVNHEVAEAVPRNIFGPFATNRSDHLQEFGIINDSQHRHCERVASSSLVNDHAEYPPSMSSSHHADELALHSAMQPALRPSNRKSSRKDLSVSNASLGPVHTTKVSKPAKKKWTRPSRQPNPPQAISSDDSQLPSNMHISTDHATPRRGKRIRSQQVSRVELTMVAGDDPSERITRSKSRQKAADNLTTTSFGKPKGISRQRRKTTRRRAN